tara:strand:+ start:88854 stop:90074 length:1221 start_codon:yes stop_codon:yes gene_type:complete
MRKLQLYKKLTCLSSYLAIGLVLAFCGCVEEIELNTESFERILVIEGTITNEYKKHEILLSNSFEFEEDGPAFESGALVQVLVDGTPTYTFTEDSPGTYLSTQAFEAQPDIEYTLYIQTQDGREFSSTPEQLTPVSEISEVNAIAETTGLGENGVSIQVSNVSPTGNANYFRFEYEETYKIIAPLWRYNELIAEDEEDPENCNVIKTVKQQEERICYNTESSIEIIVTETLSLEQDQLSNFEVKFIKKDNTIIAHRYSILLKQFVITSNAYNYFKKRNELSEEGNLFFQIQSGFVEGNLNSISSPNEKVIGFFSVSAVSQLRYFFNWDDLFPGEPYPIIPCQVSSPPLLSRAGLCYLSTFVTSNRVKYYEDNLEPQPGEGPYKVVRRECGDCTASGTNVEPDFWID